MGSKLLLDDLLAPGGLRTVFQPIYRVTPERSFELLALECLTRGPRGSTMERPDILFEYARRKREEETVDRAAVRTALETVQELPKTLRFSVNVHASTLGREEGFVSDLIEIAEELEFDLERLIVEVVEHTPYLDRGIYLRSLEKLRKLGVGIALDDLGLGQSNFRMILDTAPDLLKLDRYLVQGCGEESGRRAVLESISLLGQRIGAGIVAEGVEEPSELRTVLGLGIDGIQGFLLSGPVAADCVASLAATPPDVPIPPDSWSSDPMLMTAGEKR